MDSRNRYAPDKDLTNEEGINENDYDDEYDGEEIIDLGDVQPFSMVFKVEHATRPDEKPQNE